MVAALSTSVWLSLHALRGSPFGDLALEEVITCVALLNRGMKDCETGRLHVAEQVAYSKPLSISLNNHAAYRMSVEDATLDEQSSKAEKNTMQLLLI